MQSFGQLAGLVATIGKDNHFLQPVVSDQIDQQGEFLLRREDIDLLFNRIGGDTVWLNLHLHRIPGPLLTEPEYVIGECGGKQQRLTVAGPWCHTNDAPHLGDKAHIQHAICLINHHDFDQIQVKISAFTVIQQTTGGSYENIDKVLINVFALLVVVHAANHRDHVQGQVLGQGLSILANLQCQFPCRGDDNGARLAQVTSIRWRGFHQCLDGADQKGCGLAGTGLCLTNGIPTDQCGAKHFSLNGCAVFEALVSDGMHQLQGQLKIVKAGFFRIGRYLKLIQSPVFPGLTRRFAAIFGTRRWSFFVRRLIRAFVRGR